MIAPFRQLRDFWLGVQMCRHPDEVKFLGPCPCGCDRWRIEFRGRFYSASERTYDRLRFDIQML